MATHEAEIKGAKFEFQTELRKIQALRIGDPVKVLLKEYSNYKVYQGVVIGFVQFPELPTVSIAYIKDSYNDADLCFLDYNEKSTEVEVVPAENDDLLALEKTNVIDSLSRKIEKAETSLREAKARLVYFKRHFARYFEAIDGNPDE